MHPFVTHFLSCAVLTTVLLVAGPSQAVTIVEDTFTRSGALIGSVSDSGHTWTGSASTSNTDGSQLSVVGSVGSFATISGLTFLPNTVYTLSADIALTAGGSQWLGIGFKRPASTNATNQTNGFFLRRHDPEVETRVTGSSGTSQSFAVANSFPDTLEVILSIGSVLSDATLTWELNDVALRSDEPVDVTGIDGIFVANVSPFIGPSAVGTYDNYHLDATPVPEPGTAALLAVGLLALGRRRRPQR